jgi:peptide/nickel transport system substrate-binding protein
LILARAVDQKTFDPVQAVETETIYTLDMIFETLTVTSHDGQKTDPWLAQSWDVSADQLTWTFHLRPGVKFSDGTPMTAADVKFSLDRSRNFQGGFSFLDSAITSVDAPDEATVVIKTKFPWKPLLADLALWANAIYPKDFGGKAESEFFNAPIGTGPFMLDHWTKGVETKEVRNPNYWQPGKPYLDSVTWTFVPDDNTRILQLKGGQIQIDSFPPFATLASLKSTPSIKVQTFDSNLVSYVLMNERVKQFQDVHVRRAISYAIDAQAMAKAALFGYGSAACSFVAPTMAYYDPNTQCLKPNLDKAKAELAMSAYPNGFDTRMLVGSTDVYQESVGEIVQQQLKAINVNVTLQKVDPGQLYSTISKYDYDLAYEAWASDIPDPDEQISFMCDPVGGGAGSYSTDYKNDQVVEWVHQAEQAFDEATRADLYSKIQAQVAQDAPWAVLHFIPYQYAFSDKVHDFFAFPTGNYHMQDVWLSK